MAERPAGEAVQGADPGAAGYGSTLVAGLLGGLVILSTPMTMPAVIFTGPLERYVGLGIGLALLSSVVTCLVLAWRSSSPGILGGPHLTPGLILAVMASATTARLGPDASDGAVLGTMLALIALSSVSLGLVLVLFARCRWSQIVRYVPYPVIAGMLVYFALRLLHKSISLMLGHELTPETSVLLLQPDHLTLWLPGLLAAVGVVVVQRAGGRPQHLALYAISVLAAFWIIAWIAGASVADLQQAGFLFTQVGGGGPWSPAMLLGAVGQADWWAVLDELPALGSLWLASLIVLLLVASSIEVVTDSDSDLNRELEAAGIANLLAGPFGGLPSYHSAGATTIVYALGARSRLVGVIAAAVCAATLLFARPLFPYMPKMALGAGVIYLAFEMGGPRIWHQWRRMPRMDRGVVVLVLAGFLALGLIPGVVLGIVAGLALFAVSYGRIDPVRSAGDATGFRSKVSRPSDQVRILAEHANAIQVMALQGYLFFGSAHRFLQRAKAQMSACPAAARRFLILDFAGVDGADASALFAFTRLFQEAAKGGVVVLLAALPAPLSSALQAAGLEAAGQAGERAFVDLDHALEYAETAILGDDDAAPPRSGLDALEEAYPAVDVRRQLLTYGTLVTWQPGEWAIRQDDPSEAMYLIESGRLTVWRMRADGGRVRLGTVVPGTVIGEVGFYRRSARTASIVADQESSAFCITRQALRRMQDEDPWLSSIFHRFMAGIAADRLADNLRGLDPGG